jgi:hypothetical protein
VGQLVDCADLQLELMPQSADPLVVARPFERQSHPVGEQAEEVPIALVDGFGLGGPCSSPTTLPWTTTGAAA